MNGTNVQGVDTCQGIRVRGMVDDDAHRASQTVLEQLAVGDLVSHVEARMGRDAQGEFLCMRLNPDALQRWAPGFDTLQLAQSLQLDTCQHEADLMREIIVALLAAPVALECPSLDELVSVIRIRRNIVQAARKTTLAFDTEAAERPEGYWTYHEDTGFTILPGVSLIQALTLATQPEVSGTLYAFSCYRATEYVILLGIAQELAQSNPALFQQLQQQWTRRAIMSGEFHEVFLREQGSMDEPLPPRYFVPGDRVWFRNPEEASADASGFEGSWVIYKGGGLFTNFWIDQQPYTLTDKCVEIYHWRHGLYHDAQGEAHIDEVRIKPLIEATLNNPDELARVMAVMARYREPRGVYTSAGGCIDTTREFARWVRPDSFDLHLPVE